MTERQNDALLIILIILWDVGRGFYEKQVFDKIDLGAINHLHDLPTGFAINCAYVQGETAGQQRTGTPSG